MKYLKWLIKIPYSFAWRLTNAANNPFPIVYYCSDIDAYSSNEDLWKQFPEMTIVARNRKIQQKLFDRDLSSILWPVYPKIVIMDSDYSHLFPSKKVKKIFVKTETSSIAKNKDLFVVDLSERENTVEMVDLIKSLIKTA